MRALKVSYSDVGEGGVAVNCEKTQFFLNTLYIYNTSYSVAPCGSFYLVIGGQALGEASRIAVVRAAKQCGKPTTVMTDRTND